MPIWAVGATCPPCHIAFGPVCEPCPDATLPECRGCRGETARAGFGRPVFWAAVAVLGVVAALRLAQRR